MFIIFIMLYTASLIVTSLGTRSLSLLTAFILVPLPSHPHPPLRRESLGFLSFITAMPHGSQPCEAPIGSRESRWGWHLGPLPAANISLPRITVLVKSSLNTVFKQLSQSPASPMISPLSQCSGWLFCITYHNLSSAPHLYLFLLIHPSWQ